VWHHEIISTWYHWFIALCCAEVGKKGNRHKVERAVIGAQTVQNLHWLKIWGIVDNDGDHTTNKQKEGIYVTPYYSVEAIYYHPWFIKKIASRQASTLGGDSEQLEKSTIEKGVSAIKKQSQHLSKKSAKKICRNSINKQISNDEELCSGNNIQIENPWSSVYKEHSDNLNIAIKENDWEKILKLCPIRESEALDIISKTLKFRGRLDYEKAVKQLLKEDTEALKFVRDLFKDLSIQILK